jgi:hypothetical protein
MPKVEHSDHDVGNLDAGVVDVVLDLDLGAKAAQAAAQNVTENRISQVTDVGGLVGIDGGVLDDRFRAGRSFVLASTFEQTGKHVIAIEVEVEKTGAGDLDPDYLFGPLGRLVDLLSDLARSGLQLLRQRQGAGPGQVTELPLGRHLEPHLGW